MYCATARVPVTSLRLTNGHKNYYNYYHNYHYNFKLQFTSLVVRQATHISMPFRIILNGLAQNAFLD